MVLNARRVQRLPKEAKLVLLAFVDITDMERPDMPFDKVVEMGLFSATGKEQRVEIVRLHQEINALLARLGEKSKYNNGTK